MKKPPKQRVKECRERKEAQGLKRHELWIRSGWKDKIDKFIKKLSRQS